MLFCQKEIKRNVQQLFVVCHDIKYQLTMNRFLKIFTKQRCNVIGMIHVDPLPGTPKYCGNFNEIVEKATYEAHVYASNNLDGLLVENMHDVPYVQEKFLGPETVACMTKIAIAVRQITKTIPLGVQVLACGNEQALAIAKACDLQYIRAEGFVFGHIADEGYTNACAGHLLRYRHNIDADNVLIFTDIKKKHSSHSITSDTDLLETTKAAEFFMTDGIILTGTSTGNPASIDDLDLLYGKINSPILIGSGVTTQNLHNYVDKADGLIIGSHFKENNDWRNALSESNIKAFMENLNNLRINQKNRHH